MDYQSIFAEAIAALHAERRYRVFADLERIAGRYPYALWRNGEEAREIAVWCSNDYLGMGQNETVVDAMTEAARHGLPAAHCSASGSARASPGWSRPYPSVTCSIATTDRQSVS